MTTKQEGYAEDCGACQDRTYDNDVREFHKKFGLPFTGDGITRPGFPDQKVLDYRIKFLKEELEEFLEADAERDLGQALDALVDLAWVAIGTAHYMGLPFDAAWREVVRANMAKVRQESDPNKPYRDGVGGAVVKPPGWEGPRIESVIIDAERNFLRAKARREKALDDLVAEGQARGDYDLPGDGGQTA